MVLAAEFAPGQPGVDQAHTRSPSRRRKRATKPETFPVSRSRAKNRRRSSGSA
jgi:hypothetical protein